MKIVRYIARWLLKVLFNIVVLNESLGIKGRIRFTFQNVVTGETRVSEYHNIVVTSGKTMIAQRLAQTGNDCNITYGAVGTDATAPLAGDTTLGTELARKAVTTISNAANQVLVSLYFGPAEAIGALKEFGLFGEAADATPDSGTMVNHAAIDEAKTAAETLTIDCTLTIS